MQINIFLAQNGLSPDAKASQKQGLKQCLQKSSLLPLCFRHFLDEYHREESVGPREPVVDPKLPPTGCGPETRV
jgi:hypothetical protein